MITGRVCAHLCQHGFNRNETDKRVWINCVDRTLGFYILDNYGIYFAPPAMETSKSVAIVGFGPAGLTVAYSTMTSCKGIFGAGDAVKPGLAIDAIAAGRKPPMASTVILARSSLRQRLTTVFN